VNPDDPNAAHGFLVQEVGELAGRSDLVAGTVTAKRRLELDVRCEDGTVIRGKAKTIDDPATIRAFAKEYAGDISASRGRGE